MKTDFENKHLLHALFTFRAIKKTKEVLACYWKQLSSILIFSDLAKAKAKKKK